MSETEMRELLGGTEEKSIPQQGVVLHSRQINNVLPIWPLCYLIACAPLIFLESYHGLILRLPNYTKFSGAIKMTPFVLLFGSHVFRNIKLFKCVYLPSILV